MSPYASQPPPKPENGLVVRFLYRWAGEQEARKDRPACIMLVRNVVAKSEGLPMPEVVYLPISSKPPRDDQKCLLIPPKLAAHLEFRETHNWVIVSECNLQFWPNDLARIPGAQERWSYGFIAPNFFAKILEVFREEMRRRAVTVQNVHYLPQARAKPTA
jgi:hypothetical protein